MKFKKRPLEVEAIKVRDALKYASSFWQKLPKWLTEEYEKGNIIFGVGEVHIHTLNGKVVAKIDEWIIRGIKGELYPCAADIFTETYEEVK